MIAYPRSHLKAALALAFVLTIVITTLPADETTPLPEAPVSLELAAETRVDPVPESPVTLQVPVTNPTEKTTVTVRSGDNLARIFQKMKLPASDLHYIIELGKDVSSLRKILPGQELVFETTEEGGLVSIRYKKNAFDTLVIEKHEDQFSSRWEEAIAEKILVHELATIDSNQPSLYHAGKATGLSDNIIMKLANIFQWDISFALDLRNGDSFSLLYEEVYVDGELVSEGDIVAATFANMGKTYNAVRYTDLSGSTSYYTPEGVSMRKAFIRDPVHFSHVSSSFNLRRLHPIHKRVMPHRGIDYAARKGTPVFAAGDGKIKARRRNDAAGNHVIIQHGEQYTTKYLHLSRFAKGINPGTRVKQGQTIGYVGATGWATGEHLHYEFLVNGVHRNPRTVKLPKASPIAADELDRFKSTVTPVLVQLAAISTTGFASAKAPAQTSGD